jgi:hypothetical protein
MPNTRQLHSSFVVIDDRTAYNNFDSPLYSQIGTMTQIVLSDDQLRAVRQATDAVEIRDSHGALLGYVARTPQFTDEEIAEAQRRAASPGPWHTTAEVLDHLHSLDPR